MSVCGTLLLICVKSLLSFALVEVSLPVIWVDDDEAASALGFDIAEDEAMVFEGVEKILHGPNGWWVVAVHLDCELLIGERAEAKGVDIAADDVEELAVLGSKRVFH